MRPTTTGWLWAAAMSLGLMGCNTGDAEIPDGPCVGGICVGGNEDAGTADPCDGVVCNTPPSQCHKAEGTCAAGQCSYEIAPRQACEDGVACTVNDMCDAAGACAGSPKVCDTPPAFMCADADTSVVFDAQGSCTAGTGECAYQQTTVSCPGQCGQVTPGLCPDPCQGRVCDTPPSECFTVPGTCDMLTGACSYMIDGAITTCDDADPCTAQDSCQADGSCLGAAITCTNPPPPTCIDATTLRTATANGAACNPANSQCDYPFTDTNCGAPGCMNGACGATMCDETTCSDWAVPQTPNGSAVRTCTDPSCPTTATLPPLNQNRFNCEVQPILDSTCAFMGCHTTDTPTRRLKTYSVGLKRMAPLLSGTDHDGPVNPSYCNGTIAVWESNCVGRDPILVAESTFNFDNARLFALDAMANPANNELLTQPVANDALGHAHDGFDLFASTQDVRYQAILQWLSGQTSPASCVNTINIPTRAGLTVNGLNYNNLSCGVCGNATEPRCPGPTPATASYPCNPTDCMQ